MEVSGFVEKLAALRAAQPGKNIIPAYLALGGFTKGALAYCREHGVGTAERLHYVQKEWSF